MKLQKRLKATSEVPTCSTGDIAFLLLIFFLSTTKFDMKKGLGLVLPPPSQGENTKQVKLNDANLTKLLVNAQGQIMLNNTLTPLEEVEGQVRTLVTKNPKMVFMLKVDRQANYDSMVAVLDQLRKANATKINLSTN